MDEIEQETGSISPYGDEKGDATPSQNHTKLPDLDEIERENVSERSNVSLDSASESDQDQHTEQTKYAGMKSRKVGQIIEKEFEVEKEERKPQAVSQIVKSRHVITPIDEISDRSYSVSPTLTEQTGQLASAKGTAVSTPLPSRSKHNSTALSTPILTPVPVRSKNSGRLSPTAVSTPQSVSVGHQPVTLTRFNEPLKLRKGKHLVDYEVPGPTVVYVPHKKQTHGQWTNVTVERKPNGRYVVIEQRPVHTRFTDVSFGTKNKSGHDIFSDGYSVTVKKSPWNWSTKGNFIERQSSKGFYEPYLPPMKPKYKHVESKIGSLDNYDHIPGGGAHKVPSFKLKWEAESRIGSWPSGRTAAAMPYDSHTERNTLKLPEIVPRYGATAHSGSSLSSIHYSPGGNVFIRKSKFDSKSQVGSLDNAHYKPHGGDVHIPSHKLNWKSDSKVGSLHNITHLPKNSNIQVFSEKLDWQASAKIGSWDNADHKPKKSRFRPPHFNMNWTKTATSRVGSLVNVDHKPGGGHPQIVNEKVSWKGKPRIDSHWKFNFDYKGLFDSDFDSDTESEFHEQTFNTFRGTV